MDNNTKKAPVLSQEVLALLHVPRRIYVAVSGGADSMAMVSLLEEARRDLAISTLPTILHVHHGLRGKEADEDERFVEAWAKEQAWRFRTTHVDATKIALKTGKSIETAARDLRYAFFARVLAEEDVKEEAKPLLFVGHHQQDQAETILFHILRGCGTDGLGGMTEIEERSNFILVRPLLSATKEQILHYHAGHHSSWREDSTNREMDATRNRLRGVLFPAIRKEVNPAVDDALVRLGEIAREESNYLNNTAAALFPTISTIGEEREPFSASTLARNACFLHSIALLRSEFLAQPLAMQRRLIRYWTATLSEREQGEKVVLSFEEEEEIRRHFQRPNGKILALYGMIFLTDFEGVHALSLARFQDIEDETRQDITLSIKEKKQEWDLFLGRCEMTFFAKVDSDRVSSLSSLPSASCAIDATELDALTWRCARPGDIFVSFGGGSKPLRKMWNAWHVPVPLRKIWPVVTDGKDILWAFGLGRSAKRPVQPGRDMVMMNWRRR